MNNTKTTDRQARHKQKEKPKNELEENKSEQTTTKEAIERAGLPPDD